MKRPTPVPGLVIRYDFLWNDEQQRGRTEGSKQRPCVIVVAVPGASHVVVVPITHNSPTDAKNSIELPAAVKANLGLDDARSWIVVNELNRLRWDDPGVVPASSTRWSYGALPQSLLISVQLRIRELARVGGFALVDRREDV